VADDKPFEATAARIARAKREGDVARSHDLGAVASLGCGFAATCAVAGTLAAAAQRALRDAPAPGGGWSPYAIVAACALAPMLAALAAAVAATYAQARAWTFKMPAPNVAKLDPVRGLKRMFSRDGALAAVKAVAVSSAVAAAVVPALRGALAFGDAATPAELVAAVRRSTVATVAGALAVATLFAFGDLALERAKWLRRLRMSLPELKREHKQSEGDPQLKGRRRQAHRSLVRGSFARLAEAAFVVTNPTHVAVALEYRPPAIPVPRVLVRAIDDGARRVKRRARELRVPIVENAPLARLLLATTRSGEFIAPESYAAVAAVVAALLREGALA
jgi:flagellar biosynthesis protein FlhB